MTPTKSMLLYPVFLVVIYIYIYIYIKKMQCCPFLSSYALSLSPYIYKANVVLSSRLRRRGLFLREIIQNNFLSSSMPSLDEKQIKV